MKQVLVLGAGVGGLAVALALEDSGYQVQIVERDPPPPEIPPEEAFERWERAGVPQFRHSHILLSRLHTTLRDRHPALLSELYALGFKSSELDEMLPLTHIGRFPALPEDQDLLHLWGRRATFEYVLRKHVARLPHVTFVHSARVEGLVTEQRDGRLCVTGLALRIDDQHETRSADLVVDASGARSKSAEWLRALGVQIEVEEHESRYAYVCRHYRMQEGAREPSRRGTGANLDYLWYGLFYAEHGHFSIAIACPTDETELVEVLKRAEGFERMCERMPVLKEWTSLAEPLTSVLGARKLANRWVRYGTRGGEVLGFFPVGDSHLHSNPMYGRGCSSAFVQAHAFADALAASEDAQQRATDYYAHCTTALRSHFEASVSADRLFQSRATQLRGERLPLGARVLNWLYDEAWTPALLSSPLVAREMLKAMQMRELSDVWTRLRMVLHIARAFLRNLFGGGKPNLPKLAPDRSELLEELTTDPESRAAQ